MLLVLDLQSKKRNIFQVMKGCSFDAKHTKNHLRISIVYNFATIASQTVTHSRDGVNHAVCDLVLPHVFHHVKLSCSLLRYDLVSDLLQLRVKLFKEIFKQQRQKLEERTKSEHT